MREPLAEHAIALSISDSDDMAVLGLAKEHLDDAMAEIARHIGSPASIIRLDR